MRQLALAVLVLSAGCARHHYTDVYDPAPPGGIPTNPNVTACGASPVAIGSPAGGTVRLAKYQVAADGTLSMYDTTTAPTDVPVGPYFLDPDEVTKSCYAKCVSAGVCSEPTADIGDPDPRDWNDPGRAGEAVGGVTQYQAAQFCGWRGGRLPRVEELVRPQQGQAEPKLAADLSLLDEIIPCWSAPEPGCAALRDIAIVQEPRDISINPFLHAPRAWLANDVHLGVWDLVGGLAEWTATWKTPCAPETGVCERVQVYAPVTQFYGPVVPTDGLPKGFVTPGRFEHPAETSYGRGFRCAFDPTQP